MQGIVLHHTADFHTNGVLRELTGASGHRRASCHVVIDRDGTRFVLAEPTAITWHSGYSRWRGRDWCNTRTIGIEFMGNTLTTPLTEEQIRSAWEYCEPIMAKYGLKTKDITTHAEIRDAYIKAHPKRKVPAKVDITEEEFHRFLDRRHSSTHKK